MEPEQVEVGHRSSRSDRRVLAHAARPDDAHRADRRRASHAACIAEPDQGLVRREPAEQELDREAEHPAEGEHFGERLHRPGSSANGNAWPERKGRRRSRAG